MIGANDLSSSGRFYSAILTPLGYERTDAGNAVVFSLADVPDRLDSPSTVYVVKPYDGREATVGNGSMTAFRTATHASVRTIHAAEDNVTLCNGADGVARAKVRTNQQDVSAQPHSCNCSAHYIGLQSSQDSVLAGCIVDSI